MNLLIILIVLVVIGVVVWLVNSYIPMAEPFKKIFNGVAVVGVVIWLLHVVGAWAYLSKLTI